jgi:hypothetical protein
MIERPVNVINYSYNVTLLIYFRKNTSVFENFVLLLSKAVAGFDFLFLHRITNFLAWNLS